MTTLSEPSLPRDWPSAKRSGLLTPERIAEIEAQVAAHTEPLVTKSGKAIENAYILSFPDGTNWVYWVSDHAKLDYHQRDLIAALLTADELAAIKADSGRAYESAREAARFEKATKIPDTEYSGPCFWGDEHYWGIDEAIEAIVDNGGDDGEVPAFLWAAKDELMIPALDANDLLERYTRECDDEIDLEGMIALQLALDDFVAVNRGFKTYDIDYSRAIVLSSETRAQIDEDLGPAD